MENERVDVRAVRQKLGKTQVAFAAHFGVGVMTVKAWEAGRRRPGLERSPHRDGQAEAIQHQPSGVVHQAFTLEDDHQAPGQPQPLQHRARGNGIRRRDDGAEHEAGRP